MVTAADKRKSFYEDVVQIGDMKNTGVGTPDSEIATACLTEYMQGFQERNPNFYVFNAVLHLDEAIQPLIHQQKTVAFPQQRFHSVPSFSAEKEQTARARLQPEILLNNRCQPINRTAHVGVSADYVHLLKPGFFQHDDSPFKSVASSSGDISRGSSAVIPPPLIRMSPASTAAGFL